MSVLKLIKSYNFADKDPAVDYLRGPFEADPATVHAVAIRAGVASSTVTKIFYGDTRKPQFATMVRIARAIGPDGVRALVKCVYEGGTDIKPKGEAVSRGPQRGKRERTENSAARSANAR